MGDFNNYYAIVFDTETTGLPKNFKSPLNDLDNWPRCVQLAWQIFDKEGNLLKSENKIIKPDGFDIPFLSTKIHGISNEIAQKEGVEFVPMLKYFLKEMSACLVKVGHNLSFDINVLGCEHYRYFPDTKNPFEDLDFTDTCTEQTANLLQLTGGRGKFKFPKLGELYFFLFEEELENAHNALIDVAATARCFFQLILIKNFTREQLKFETGEWEKLKSKYPDKFPQIEINQNQISNEENSTIKDKKNDLEVKTDDISSENTNLEYTHLHTFSEFSILESCIKIDNEWIDHAVNLGYKSVSITDKNTLMGALYFLNNIEAHNSKNPDSALKSIIGSQINITKDLYNKTDKNDGNFVVFLCKNTEGYHNLVKLSSLSQCEGFYYVPRIDKKLLLKYKEGLIVLSGGIWGLITTVLLQEGKIKAKEELLWWKENFGEDFYVQITNHDLEDEKFANKELLELANELGIVSIASNYNYYLKPEDSKKLEKFICIKNGEYLETPIGRGPNYRYGLPNNRFNFCSKDEMLQRFSQNKELLTNTQQIVDKIEGFAIKKDITLPVFKIPKEFIPKNPEDIENEYLRYLAYKGAEGKYPELNDVVRDRIEFELDVIKKIGFPGYFLIVQDIILHAKKIDVPIGPGRGSAAGSVIAYCIGITNIDPIFYNLLFERFLNPDRISLPDIDIDIDNEGREILIQYIVETYGQDNVAQIITFSQLQSKSAIKDAARIIKLPVYISNRISKNFPDISIKNFLDEDIKTIEKDEKLNLKKNEVATLLNIKEEIKSDLLVAQTFEIAKEIEGSIRNTGIHASGYIISPKPIMDIAPITISNKSKLYLTQFDNEIVESAGLLKVDLLGLKTLKIIRDALKIIKTIYKKDIDIFNIPLDDPKTYELFQKGDTIGIFQFESEGMQKTLIDLEPTNFKDLVALNALYRPGPMDYIDSFIKRKKGQESIEYDIPIMEEILKETYGITVYQEQVMLLSRKLADFTAGEADTLRKGIGKKLPYVIEKLKPKFIAGCEKNNYKKEVAEKIWKDWEAFAKYAFNKSHAVCYSIVGYQTAYLKANYPVAFMAANMTSSMKALDSLTKFLKECQNMKIPILPPDINESKETFFVVNRKIRYALSGIKGLSQNAIMQIVEGQSKYKYSSIFDLASKFDAKTINKKNLESLVKSGAFDSFGYTRSTYFMPQNRNGENLIDQAINISKKSQAIELKPNEVSLFSNSEIKYTVPEVEVIKKAPFGVVDLLNEKEHIGFYLSSHPTEFYNYLPLFLPKLTNFTEMEDGEIGSVFKILCFVESTENFISKNNSPYGKYSLSTPADQYQIFLFSNNFTQFHSLLALHKCVILEVELVKSGRKGEDKNISIQKITPADSFLKNCKKIQLTLYQNIDLNKLGVFIETFANEDGIPLNIAIQKDFTEEKNEFYNFKTNSAITNYKDFFDKLKEIFQFRIIFINEHIDIYLEK